MSVLSTPGGGGCPWCSKCRTAMICNFRVDGDERSGCRSLIGCLIRDANGCHPHSQCRLASVRLLDLTVTSTGTSIETQRVAEPSTTSSAQLDEFDSFLVPFDWSHSARWIDQSMPHSRGVAYLRILTPSLLPITSRRILLVGAGRLL